MRKLKYLPPLWPLSILLAVNLMWECEHLLHLSVHCRVCIFFCLKVYVFLVGRCLSVSFPTVLGMLWLCRCHTGLGRLSHLPCDPSAPFLSKPSFTPSHSLAASFIHHLPPTGFNLGHSILSASRLFFSPEVSLALRISYFHIPLNSETS